jgi:hypothetical protein
MAGIDYTIPGQIRPIQVESPMNAMAQAMQLRNLQESSQMNALKVQEAQETSRQRNALAQYLANPNKPTDPLELEAGVRKVAPLLADQFVDTQLKRADLGVRTKEHEAKTLELKTKAEERERALSKEKIETAINDITSFDTLDEIRMDIGRKVASGDLKQEDADRVLAGLPTDDSGVPAWQLRTVRSLLSAKDRLADVRAEKKDVREEQRLTNEEARLKLEDARIQEQTRHANTMERISQAGADRAQLQLEETTRHNKAMERLQLAQLNKPAAGDNPNKVAHTSTDDQGNVTFYNAFGQVLRTEANAGKRSPNVIKAEQAEKNSLRDIERATKELADITKDGGLIDQATGSGAGRLVDLGAQFIGKAMPGDIATGKLQPIADMVLKMVPRFEGPQSDKDTASYKEAAGQLANPNLPNEIRKEAGKTILRLMKERKDQFVGEGMDTSPSQRKAPPPPSGFVPDKK